MTCVINTYCVLPAQSAIESFMLCWHAGLLAVISGNMVWSGQPTKRLTGPDRGCHGIGVKMTARTTVPFVAFAATCHLLLIPNISMICQPLLEVGLRSAYRGVGIGFAQTTYWKCTSDCMNGSMYADVPIIEVSYRALQQPERVAKDR